MERVIAAGHYLAGDQLDDSGHPIIPGEQMAKDIALVGVENQPAGIQMNLNLINNLHRLQAVADTNGKATTLNIQTAYSFNSDRFLKSSAYGSGQ